MKGKRGLLRLFTYTAQREAKRGISLLLTLCMLLTTMEMFFSTGIVANAEEVGFKLNVTNLVQVKIDDEVTTLQLYNRGVYEAKVDMGTSTTEPEEISQNDVSGNDDNGNETGEAIEAQLLVNGEVISTKTLHLDNLEGGVVPVYFRVQDGKFLDSINDSDYWHSAAWIGDFAGITFFDDNGQSFTFSENDESWDVTNENTELNYLGGGIYAKTFNFKSLTEDYNSQYRIAFDDNWDYTFGGEGLEGEDNAILTIPAGTESITIWVDEIGQKVYDSINTEPFEYTRIDGDAGTLMPFQSTVSILGDVRGDDSDPGVNWEAGIEGFEFTQITDSLYLYQKQFNTETYGYKVEFDYAHWYEKDEKNKEFEIFNDGTNVVFLYDAATEELYDTENNALEVASALGMEAVLAVTEVDDVNNGMIRFRTITEKSVKKVELVYGYKNEVEEFGKNALRTLHMSYNEADNSYVSEDIYLGDDALDLIYYPLINGYKNLVESKETVQIDGVDYLNYTREPFTGRDTFILGSFPGASWDSASNVMKYVGNGLYEYTFEEVPPADYEYIISHDENWLESYGVNGMRGGPNIKITVTEEQDVTVYYSDFSHYSKTSVGDDYNANIKLTGDGIPADTVFVDSRLGGFYSALVELKRGTYSNTKIEYKGESYTFDEYKIEEEQRGVSFYFDPVSKVFYNDAYEYGLDHANIYYNTHDTAYKSVYGAVALGEEVKYSIQTGGEVISVKFIAQGQEFIEIDMDEDGETQDGYKMWSTTVSYDKLGEYKYYFVVSNGSAVAIYGDDKEADYGEGVPTEDMVSVVPYDQIVYDAEYKTPDWMKNATIYQIFPERFFDADVSNNRAQTTARGAENYEYVTDWYMYPENPEQMELNPDQYPAEAYKGDGNWSNEIYGGDLKGITEKIDYLKALGVNVIYLNPVFASISSDRYDVSDYGYIDPILGTEGDFDELVKVAKEKDMHVILDGVFNHVSDDSKYFDRYYKYLEAVIDSKETKKAIGAYPYWAFTFDKMNEGMTQADAESAAKAYFTAEYGINDWTYTGWFDFGGSTEYLVDVNGNIVKDTIGLRKGKDVYSYDCWWGYDSMPVILATNGSEYQTPGYAEEIIGTDTSDGSITQYWLAKGMGGWRLDVANKVSDETWQNFRKSVKALDNDNVIIGEIWTDPVEYLMGDMYDSVMNYAFRDAAISYASGEDAGDYAKTLEKLRERYPKEAYYAMMNLVGSHDTTRVLSYLDGIDDDRNQKELDKAFPTYEATSDEAKQKQYLVAFLQYTYPGAPTVYYGDEIGMVGSDDPDDRRAMLWGKGNKEIVEWYATLGTIRQEYELLRTGDIKVFDSGSKPVLAFARSESSVSGNGIVVLANNANEDITVKFNLNDINVNGSDFVDAVTGQKYSAEGEMLKVDVPAYSGLILVKAEDVKEVKVDKENLKPAYDSAYTIADAKVTISQESASLDKGGKVTLTATGRGTITWSTTDANVATVDKGVVTAVGGGKADIIASHEDGLTAVCKVTVKGSPADVIAANSVSLDKTAANIEKGKSLTLKATINPKNVTDASLTWSSSNAAVAAVNNNGVVEAKATGKATITVKTANGKTAACEVTVVISANKVYTLSNMTLVKGTTRTLTATVHPSNTTDKITWKSSNKNVTVDAKGKIKGVKSGTATITVTATSGKKATCKVTVVNKTLKAKKVKLSKKKLTLKVGEFSQLKATMTSKKSTDTLKFTSSKKSVASVDKNGLVIAKKPGKATITVKTSSGKKAACIVTVKAPATKVVLNKTTATLKKGKTLKLKATMTPKNSSDTLKWSTSKKSVATVDKKGVVKAKKAGKATITVTTSSGKKATCKITVK